MILLLQLSTFYLLTPEVANRELLETHFVISFGLSGYVLMFTCRQSAEFELYDLFLPSLLAHDQDYWEVYKYIKILRGKMLV